MQNDTYIRVCTMTVAYPRHLIAVCVSRCVKGSPTSQVEWVSRSFTVSVWCWAQAPYLVSCSATKTILVCPKKLPFSISHPPAVLLVPYGRDPCPWSFWWQYTKEKSTVLKLWCFFPHLFTSEQRDVSFARTQGCYIQALPGEAFHSQEGFSWSLRSCVQI